MIWLRQGKQGILPPPVVQQVPPQPHGDHWQVSEKSFMIYFSKGLCKNDLLLLPFLLIFKLSVLDCWLHLITSLQLPERADANPHEEAHSHRHLPIVATQAKSSALAAAAVTVQRLWYMLSQYLYCVQCRSCGKEMIPRASCRTSQGNSSFFPCWRLMTSLPPPRWRSLRRRISPLSVRRRRCLFQTAAPAAAAVAVPAQNFAEPTNVSFAAVAASQPVAFGRPTKVPQAMGREVPI